MGKKHITLRINGSIEYIGYCSGYRVDTEGEFVKVVILGTDENKNEIYVFHKSNVKIIYDRVNEPEEEESDNGR